MYMGSLCRIGPILARVCQNNHDYTTTLCHQGAANIGQGQREEEGLHSAADVMVPTPQVAIKGEAHKGDNESPTAASSEEEPPPSVRQDAAEDAKGQKEVEEGAGAGCTTTEVRAHEEERIILTAIIQHLQVPRSQPQQLLEKVVKEGLKWSPFISMTGRQA